MNLRNYLSFLNYKRCLRQSSRNRLPASYSGYVVLICLAMGLLCMGLFAVVEIYGARDETVNRIADLERFECECRVCGGGL